LSAAVTRRAALTLPLGLGGCANGFDPPQTRALLLHPPADLAPSHFLADVPFFAQTRYHCGPASLAMALRHVGLPATPEGLADAVFLPSRQGALQDEMLAGARRSGALAFVLEPRLQSLCREVAAGHAVVVLQNLMLGAASGWHYAVTVGYELLSPRTQGVYLHSGSNANQFNLLSRFERTWAHSEHWAMVALPPGRWPHTVSQAQAVAAAQAFERVGSLAHQVQAYRSLLKRWPNNLPAAMGWGNALAAQGDWLGAVAAFEAASQAHDSAALWHNLGVARLRLGQRAAAAQAAARALSRAQSQEPAWVDRARALVEAIGPAP
jgi:tetratricopeptide (TPR) repeat protein